MQHANRAVDEVRRAEFFRKGGRMRGLVKGIRWLLLTRWTNLDSRKRQLLNDLFRLNRHVVKAYLLKESGPPLDLHLRGSSSALSERLGGATAMAAAGAL